MERKGIVAAGHICLDITPKFQNKKEEPIGKLLVPGHLLAMGAADVHVGGSVANTGLGLKILGADVSLMGKVGRDAFGELVRMQLAGYQADEGMIVSKGEDTSYSIVVAPPGTDRIFLHHSGANDSFSCEDLDYGLVEKAQLFHFGYPPLMRRMYEDQGEELTEMFRRVHAAGCATSLDMAAVDEDSPAGEADWREILERVLPYVDFFVPSVEELAYMTDRKRYEEWMERAGGEDVTRILRAEEDIRPLAEQLIEMGAKVVLIKCGAPGMYLASGNQEAVRQIGGGLGECMDGWKELRHFEASYRPEQVLSGTGAGDTSIAAFLYAVTKGYTWDRCLRLAAATGASCVEAYDALSGLRSFEELERKISGGWAKV